MPTEFNPPSVVVDAADAEPAPVILAPGESLVQLVMTGGTPPTSTATIPAGAVTAQWPASVQGVILAHGPVALRLDYRHGSAIATVENAAATTDDFRTYVTAMQARGIAVVQLSVAALDALLSQIDVTSGGPTR